MLAPNKTSAALADKNTELTVRLKLSEEQNRLLRQESERLKPLEQTCEQLRAELKQKSERTVLLEEELRWLKAQYYGAFTDGYLFADDSGLEVDALGGAPGVHSARYAGTEATDADNNRLLLQRLTGIADRTARYQQFRSAH